MARPAGGAAALPAWLPAAAARAQPRAGVAPASNFSIRNFLAVFKYSRRALELVWSTNKFLSIVIALLTVAAGALPAGVAYVGSLIVDAVVAAIRAGGHGFRPCHRAGRARRAC